MFLEPMIYVLLAAEKGDPTGVEGQNPIRLTADGHGDGKVLKISMDSVTRTDYI